MQLESKSQVLALKTSRAPEKAQRKRKHKRVDVHPDTLSTRDQYAFQSAARNKSQALVHLALTTKTSRHTDIAHGRPDIVNTVVHSRLKDQNNKHLVQSSPQCKMHQGQVCPISRIPACKGDCTLAHTTQVSVKLCQNMLGGHTNAILVNVLVVIKIVHVLIEVVVCCDGQYEMLYLVTISYDRSISTSYRRRQHFLAITTSRMASTARIPV